MWKLFQQRRQKMEEELSQLSASDLHSQLVTFSDKFVIFDIRGRREVEMFPYIIPGALLTTNVSLSAMISSIPPQSTVVLYASDNIPDNCIPHWAMGPGLRGCVLNGGLRAWYTARLPMESVTKYQWCSR